MTHALIDVHQHVVPDCHREWLGGKGVSAAAVTTFRPR